MPKKAGKHGSFAGHDQIKQSTGTERGANTHVKSSKGSWRESIDRVGHTEVIGGSGKRGKGDY